MAFTKKYTYWGFAYCFTKEIKQRSNLSKFEKHVKIKDIV